MSLYCPEQDRPELEDAMALIRDGTLSHLRILMRDGYAGYLGKHSLWTGRYCRSDTYVPHDVGYLLGKLWVLFEHTGDEEFAHFAARILEPMIPDLTERPHRMLAVGLDIYLGLCLGADVTGSERLRELAIKGSRIAVDSMWSDRQQRFRTFVDFGHTEFPVEFGGCIAHLAWGGPDDPVLLEKFTLHVLSMLRVGLVRPDGSTHHVARVEGPDEVCEYDTLQGWRADSTWARGQSWALYGFVIAAQATGDSQIVDAADRLAEYWLDNLPDDWVPYYDFDDPIREQGPRDSCAATMATSAIMSRIRLDQTFTKRQVRVVNGTIAELCRNYVGFGGVMLHSSMGRVGSNFYEAYAPFTKTTAGDTTRDPGGGHRGVWGIRFPQEDLLPYGSYFMTEILHRSLNDDHGLLRLLP